MLVSSQSKTVVTCDEWVKSDQPLPHLLSVTAVIKDNKDSSQRSSLTKLRTEQQMAMENNTFSSNHEIWNAMEKKRPIALVVGIITVAMSPLIVIGNSLIIIVVWKDPLRNLRSFTSSTILLSMAIADFLVGSILCPLHADWSLLTGVGNQPSFSVGVPLAINAVLTSVSVGHVLLLTIDRLLALLAPFQYRVKVTNKRVSIAAIVIWGYAFVLGVLHAVLLEHFIIFSTIYTAQVLIVVATIICINIVILYHFRSNSTRNVISMGSVPIRHFYHREKHLCKSIALIVCAFLVCFIPWFIIESILYFCLLCGRNLDFLMKGLWFSSIFIYINSALNPFLYSWRLARFRDSLKHLLSGKGHHRVVQRQQPIKPEQFDTRL